MDTKSLMTFVAVVDSGGFTSAGRRLGVSQSAVSQQVRSLERELGATLLSRAGRSIRLTQAGDALLPYARQILAKLDEARAAVSDFETAGRGRVSIGAGGTVCHHILPSVLREFAERFAGVDVHVVSGYSAQTVSRVTDGTVDFGIVVLPVQEKALVTTELGRDELVAVARPDHPWASREIVRPADFADERLIAYDRVSQTFRILERFLLEAGVFPRIAMEIDDLEAVKRMVAEGLGISALARWTVERELDEGVLVARRLGTAGLHRTWGLIRRAGEPMTAAQRGFLAACTSRFSQALG
ncbi:MAG: LysR family transcriptional regulator [Deltaproteobacteria bacterium]|nr:MAG: LysR family transcriptional regulator [Deltaproteobacteria bacterium]